jgi:hypothetical protein
MEVPTMAESSKERSCVEPRQYVADETEYSAAAWRLRSGQVGICVCTRSNVAVTDGTVGCMRVNA